MEADINIDRQRTAIKRKGCSRPMKCALADKVLVPGMSLLDYGCGHGQDVEFATELGIDARGYDSYFFPDEPPKSADVVALIYVLNVIENPIERKAILKKAFALANICLVVAVQPPKAKAKGASAFGDGYRTTRNTFQKYYRTGELKEFLTNTLKTTPYSADTTTRYLFKDRMAEDLYLINKITKNFPAGHESIYGEAKRILANFQDNSVIRQEIYRSPIGKKLPNTLYVHNSAIPYLSTTLRLYVASGQVFVTKDYPGALLVKICPKSISFLHYHDFDNDPHPQLLCSLLVNTETYRTSFRDYSKSDNPPILHRKETFVAKDHPRYQQFRALTVHEEKLGLLNRTDIGYKKNWQKLTNSYLSSI